ncbi:MAG TPA: ATP synthase F1 subunit delta [Acidimicrobiia bacterium]
MSAVSEAAARVYAKALFELGRGEGELAAIGEDLHGVQGALNGLEGDLRAFFNLPQLRRDDKRRIINTAFGGKVGRPVLGLLNVLVEKRREALFDEIVTQFDTMLDRHEGRLQVQVTSARKLDDDVAAALRSAIERRTNKTVVLQERVDPEVIGGLKVNVGDRVVDGTMRRTLQDMRRTLTATKL